MKVLVLNGSPKKKSDTLTITEAFVDGLNAEEDCFVTTVDVINKKINPCLGCFQCMKSANNRCAQEDDQNNLLELMISSDIIIWSFPLYFFSLPSHLKAVLDRTLPLGRKEMKIENERVVHLTNIDMKQKQYIMISGCGFPYFEDNFKAVKQMFMNIYPALTTICISEAPMLNAKSAVSLAEPLLAHIRNAGIEYRKMGKLSDETVSLIETPMLDRDVYIQICNNE